MIKTKLTYKISRQTNFSKEEINARTRLVLRESGYSITDISDDKTYFSLLGWGLAGSQVGKADAGNVSLVPIKSAILVEISYEINLIYNIAFLIFFIFCSFYFDWIFVVPVICLILLTLLSLTVTKKKHEELLKKITSDNA